MTRDDVCAVAGVDIGGTKTQIRISAGGRIVADLVHQTVDWRTAGNVADAAQLVALVKRACERWSLAALAIGAHGCDTAGDCTTFERRLQSLMACPVRVVNDAELFAPAANLPDGIGLVAGTGSIAVARGTDGAMLVAGGWGWILGDEGSASGLLREAVKAVRGSIDRAEPRDALFDALCQSLGVESETEFGRRLAGIGSAAGFGRHANAVFSAAAAGSRLAHGVIHDGARALAGLVRRVVDRGASSRNVVAAGGVIVAQPSLFDHFERELSIAVPDATAQLLRQSPVAGAVVLAQRLVADPAPRLIKGVAS